MCHVACHRPRLIVRPRKHDSESPDTPRPHVASPAGPYAHAAHAVGRGAFSAESACLSQMNAGLTARHFSPHDPPCSNAHVAQQGARRYRVVMSMLLGMAK